MDTPTRGRPGPAAPARAPLSSTSAASQQGAAGSGARPAASEVLGTTAIALADPVAPASPQREPMRPASPGPPTEGESGMPILLVKMSRREGKSSWTEPKIKYMFFSLFDIYTLPQDTNPPPTFADFRLGLRSNSKRFLLDPPQQADGKKTASDVAPELPRLVQFQGAPAVQFVATPVESLNISGSRSCAETYVMGLPDSVDDAERDAWLNWWLVRLQSRAKPVLDVLKASPTPRRPDSSASQASRSDIPRPVVRSRQSSGSSTSVTPGKSLGSTSTPKVVIDMTGGETNVDSPVSVNCTLGPSINQLSTTAPGSGVGRDIWAAPVRGHRFPDFASALSKVGDWFGDVSNAVAGINGTAEPLADMIGSFALVGPVVSVVAVTSRLVKMYKEMGLNETRLAKALQTAEQTWRDVLSDVKSILESNTEDNIVRSRSFQVVEETLRVMIRCERHLMSSSVTRFFNSDEAEEILNAMESAIDRAGTVHAFKIGVHSSLQIRDLRDEFQRKDLEKQRQLDELRLCLRLMRIEDQRAGDRYRPNFDTVQDVSGKAVEDKQRWALVRTGLIQKDRGGPRVLTIAISGPAGVGKTTASRSVTYHLLMDGTGRTRFPDGMYCFKVGVSPTLNDICELIEELVRTAGQTMLVEEIRLRKEFVQNDSVIEVAASIARRCFENKRILLVIDQIGRGVRCARQWVALFASIPGPGSGFVFTTSEDTVAEFAMTRVPFDRLTQPGSDARTASEIFSCHLGNSAEPRTDGPDDIGAKDAMLEFCDGLPYAIAVCATLVRNTGFKWQAVWERIREMSSHVPGDTLARNRNLFVLMALSLRELDSSAIRTSTELSAQEWIGLQERFDKETCFTLLYASLTVVRREQPQVPLDVLARLWGLSGESGVHLAAKICRMFKSYELVENIEVSDWPSIDRASETLVLHELQVECVEFVSRWLTARNIRLRDEPLSSASWHMRLLQNYCQETLGAPISTTTDWSPIWSGLYTGSSVDWYWVENIERHARAVAESCDPEMRRCLDQLEKFMPTARVREMELFLQNTSATEAELRENLNRSCETDYKHEVEGETRQIREHMLHDLTDDQ